MPPGPATHPNWDRLYGKPYGNPFGVEVAFGDPMLGLPDTVVAEDLLGFAGIAPPTLRI